tara:strand:+ start:565 stop:801 length:237 start_codon:yes stop_codon:yes gene_type:complete
MSDINEVSSEYNKVKRVMRQKNAIRGPKMDAIRQKFYKITDEIFPSDALFDMTEEQLNKLVERIKEIQDALNGSLGSR